MTSRRSRSPRPGSFSSQKAGWDYDLFEELDRVTVEAGLESRSQVVLILFFRQHGVEGLEGEVASAYTALGAAARISAVARSEPSTRLADRFIIGSFIGEIVADGWREGKRTHFER